MTPLCPRWGAWRAGLKIGDSAYAAASQMEPTSRDDDVGLDASYKPLMASAKAVSFPATVCSGFVVRHTSSGFSERDLSPLCPCLTVLVFHLMCLQYYNIVTFATDIKTIGGQVCTSCGAALSSCRTTTGALVMRACVCQNWPKTFLGVNAVTFAFGIVAVSYAVLLGAYRCQRCECFVISPRALHLTCGVASHRCMYGAPHPVSACPAFWIQDLPRRSQKAAFCRQVDALGS